MTEKHSFEIPPFNTCAETAAMFHVHVRTVRRWLEEGKLKAFRPGSRKLYITRESILQRIQDSEVIHFNVKKK